MDNQSNSAKALNASSKKREREGGKDNDKKEKESKSKKQRSSSSVPKGKVRAFHILKKHKDSSRPYDRNKKKITRTKEEAREEIEGFKDMMESVEGEEVRVVGVGVSGGEGYNGGESGGGGKREASRERTSESAATSEACSSRASGVE